MTLSPFIGPKCQEIRAHLDSYLSGELLVETTESVQTHLARCPGCRGELDRRAALREALRAALTESLPETAALERRIMAGVNSSRRPGWLRPAVPLAAAAALILAVVAWRALPGPGPAPETARSDRGTGPVGAVAGVPESAAAPSAVPAVDLAFYTDTALSHTYCALKRAMPDPPPTDLMATQQLERYAGLLAAVGPDLTGYTVADAHVCPNGDRRYAHLILQKGDELSSVFVTAKTAGDLPPADRTVATDEALVFVRREGDLSISAVETDRHVGFIVQSAETPDTRFPTTTLARDVAGYLTQLSSRQAMGVGR